MESEAGPTSIGGMDDDVDAGEIYVVDRRREEGSASAAAFSRSPSTGRVDDDDDDLLTYGRSARRMAALPAPAMPEGTELRRPVGGDVVGDDDYLRFLYKFKERFDRYVGHMQSQLVEMKLIRLQLIMNTTIKLADLIVDCLFTWLICTASVMWKS